MKKKQDNKLTLILIAILIVGAIIFTRVSDSGNRKSGLQISMSVDDPDSTSRSARVTYGETTDILVKQLRAMVTVTNLPQSDTPYSNIRMLSGQPSILEESCKRVVFRTNAITGGTGSQYTTGTKIILDGENDGTLNCYTYSTGTGFTPPDRSIAPIVGKTVEGFDIYKDGSIIQTQLWIDTTAGWKFYVALTGTCDVVTTNMPTEPYTSNNQETTKLPNIASLAVGESESFACLISDTRLNTLIGTGYLPWGVTMIAHNDLLGVDDEPYFTDYLNVLIEEDLGGYVVDMGVSAPTVTFRTTVLEADYANIYVKKHIAVNIDNAGDLEAFYLNEVAAVYNTGELTTWDCPAGSSLVVRTPEGYPVCKPSIYTYLYLYSPYLTNDYRYRSKYIPVTTSIPENLLLTYPIEPYASLGQETYAYS